MSALVVDGVRVEEPRCICRCYGSRCDKCRVWLTKHDDSPEMALEYGRSALVSHRCKK